jgi:hypothetical protein
MPDWPRLTFAFIRALMLRGYEYFKIIQDMEDRKLSLVWPTPYSVYTRRHRAIID